MDYCYVGDFEVIGGFIMCFENRILVWVRGFNIYKIFLFNLEVFINSSYLFGCFFGGFVDKGSSC